MRNCTDATKVGFCSQIFRMASTDHVRNVEFLREIVTGNYLIVFLRVILRSSGLHRYHFEIPVFTILLLE